MPTYKIGLNLLHGLRDILVLSRQMMHEKKTQA